MKIIYEILTVIRIWKSIVLKEIVEENAHFTYVAFEKNNWLLDIVSYRDKLLVNIESKHVAFQSDAANIF